MPKCDNKSAYYHRQERGRAIKRGQSTQTEMELGMKRKEKEQTLEKKRFFHWKHQKKRSKSTKKRSHTTHRRIKKEKRARRGENTSSGKRDRLWKEIHTVGTLWVRFPEAYHQKRGTNCLGEFVFVVGGNESQIIALGTRTQE